MRHEVRRLELPADPSAMMRLVVVSDSHGRPHRNVLPLVKQLEPAAILHAGDVGPLTLLDRFETIAPTIAVRGNVDSRATGLFDIVTVELHDDQAVRLRLLLVHIGIARSRLRREIRELAQRREAQLVVCGHSHIPWLGTDDGVAVLNPGSIGPRRFSLPITMGSIDVKREGVTMQHWDCETMQWWNPAEHR